MTIEEAIGAHDLLNTQHSLEYVTGFADGVRAKEAELSGATIIPEGWYYVRTYWSELDCKYKTVWGHMEHELVYGAGKTEHGSMQNAIKQINNA
jgi:hypothetical protein